KAGTSEVIASGDHFFNRGAIHKLSDGIAISGAPASVIADKVIFGRKYDDSIVAYTLGPEAKRATELWQTKALSELDKIHLKAGSRLYGSGDGVVQAVDIPTGNAKPKVSWQARVDGNVWSMIAADDKLFATNLEGKLYCFASKKTKPKHHAPQIKPLPARSRHGKNRVREILQTSGEKDGYCLLLGLDDGQLLYELLNQSELHVVALDPDAEKVAAMRRRLDDAGLYGTRAAVHVGEITTMRLPPYMVNLIVAQDLKAADFEKNDIFFQRVFHSLRPYGGTTCVLAPSAMLFSGE
ncbi:MAG: class I SAM-dependent methyltransferase, partial [Planctomycetota bacterium]